MADAGNLLPVNRKLPESGNRRRRLQEIEPRDRSPTFETPPDGTPVAFKEAMKTAQMSGRPQCSTT
jgi:hypothetical protein